jgi:hypothetical protein
LLLALERRRIADYADFQGAITAGICDRRNGVKVHFARQQPKSSADAAPSAKCGAPREDIQNARRIIGQGQGWIDRLEQALKSGAVLAATAAAVLGTLALYGHQLGAQQ